MIMMTTHNEATTGQMTKDDRDEGRLATTLISMECSITNYKLTEHDEQGCRHCSIQESMLGAERLDNEQLGEFVKKRMCEPPESEQHISTKAPIHMNKASLFSLFYTIVEDVKASETQLKWTETYCKGLELLIGQGVRSTLTRFCSMS